jgi:hypothetical protein
MASVADEKIMHMVMTLVADDHRAVDFELGLCRFCSARVESSDPHDLEAHRSDCPWDGVRRELGLA